MTNPDDESTPRPAGPTGAGEPVSPPPASDPTPPPPPPSQGFPAAPPPPPSSPPAAGVPGASTVAPTAPPTTVNIAFWLYIVGAVLSVVSGIITIAVVSGSRADQVRIIEQQGGDLKGLTAQQVADASVTFLVTWSIVTLIFWAIVFVLFAYFMRRGANWARIVLTVLTVLSLLNLLTGFGTGLLQVLATIVAVVLMWLRPSSAYFAAVKAAKGPRV
ncbi:hypothetical protein [Leifsonia sp. 21MFCrub1.1]|uniref:hypothetical protein n=1 Tax=Leifsonia sp. 21MFCrub1.1 TaxID=1798223 RepID=UPI0008928085|nr:hypothetical protein [Leifsonia sp. 21MFCrub1.1]SEB15054.1 hypothetical protein SAMN04515680_3772 [Leifsonia sp. 21MFCrub1.1]